MKHPSLRERIPAALRLGSMTIGEISRCLSVDPHSAWKIVDDLASRGVIRVVGKRCGRGRPWNVYANAA